MSRVAKNDFLARREQRESGIMHAAERLTEQFMEDTLVCALRRKGYGYKRVCDMLTLWGEIRKEYAPALLPKTHKEADVAQEHMDDELRDVCKGHQEIIEFRKRYPELKEITYEGRMR